MIYLYAESKTKVQMNLFTKIEIEPQNVENKIMVMGVKEEKG